jgi:hypothetical protein
MTKEPWFRIADNPKAIETLYESVPTLGAVELSWLEVRAEGRLSLVLRLPRYPDHPSPKWDTRCNAVSVHLAFYGVHQVELSGAIAFPVLDVAVSRQGDGTIAITAQGSATRIAFACSDFRIERFDTYIDQPRT